MKKTFLRRSITASIRFLFVAAVCATALFGHYYKGGPDPFADRDSESVARTQESYFSDILYHLVELEKPRLFLESTEMTLMGETADRILMTRPQGLVYSPTGDAYNYTALTGRVEQAQSMLYLEGEVAVKGEVSEWFSNTARYMMDADILIGLGSVETTTKSATTGDTILVKAQSVEARPKLQQSNYAGDVEGKITRVRAYEPPIYFGSDQLYLDVVLGQANLLGNVYVRKQQVTAESKRGEIFLENYNKKLKYYVLYDDVKVSEKVTLTGPAGPRRFTRRALSEKLEGMIAEDRIILTGYPKVFQEKDVIKGNRIILRENNEVVEVDDANTNFLLR